MDDSAGGSGLSAGPEGVRRVCGQRHSKIIGLDCCTLFGILGLLSLQHPLSPLPASLQPHSRQLCTGHGGVLSSPEEQAWQV